MKYAVISDVHANLQALETTLKDAQAHGAEQIVCLGDVVGYGPLPAETLRLVRSVAETVIAGNHDDAVSGRISTKGFIELAADAVQRHREALTPEDLEWLGNLPYTAEIDGAIIAHGDFTDPPAFRYMINSETVTANLAATDAQLMFVGHTHVPGVYLVGRSGKLYRIDPEDFTLEDNKRYIVNPGSVGYPREKQGQCYSSYVLYDSTEHTIQFRLLPFTVASVMQRGTNRSIRKRLVAAAVAVTAIVSSALALLLSPRGTVNDDNSGLVVTNIVFAPPNSAKGIRPGLKLERGDGVILELVFRREDKSEIDRVVHKVKQARNATEELPKRTDTVEISVLRLNPESEPRIRELNPTWE